MENKTVFRVGDVVYHYGLGKGVVKALLSAVLYPLSIVFEAGEYCFTLDGRDRASDAVACISFTPYTLEGFS